jgi:hypothetical protein
LLDWVESIKNDPDILKAVDQGDPGPVRFLEENLELLISKMDLRADELDRLMEAEGKSHALVRPAAEVSLLA